ncbi:hypothetical protein IJ384_03415 [bacterium]|nr:hypothetical protein [bacterium]
MTNFEKFKQALKKREEENYLALKAEIKKLQANIERFFELFFESTTSKSQTQFNNLSMY